MNGDRTPQRDAPWVMRTYSGHSTARASNELYRTNLAKGQTGLSIAFDLPDPDRLRPRRARGGRRGRQGRRPRGPPRATWTSCSTASPWRTMNTSMTINATAAWLLGLYVAHAAGHGRRPGACWPGTTQNDIVKEYLSRGHLHLPARPEPAPHRRHHRLHGAPGAQVEPDQRLQLPPPGGGGHAGAGDRLRAGHRHRRARRRARLGQDRRRRSCPAVVGRISFFVNSGVRFVEETCKMRAFTPTVGPHLPRALRRRGPQAAPLPLRGAGQLARPDRAAAREQRAAHRARDARRHAVARAPGPGPCSCRRGTRRSACPGPGTSSGRCACSRSWPSSPTCSSTTTSSRARTVIEAKTAELAEAATAELADVRGARRRLRGHRRAQAPARAQPGRAGAAHRVRRAAGGRRQLLHRDGALAAAGRRRDREHPEGRPPRRGRADRRRGALAGRARRRPRCAPRSTSCAGWPTTTGPDGNIMEATIALAHAGGTTGEWAGALREVFGEFRAPDRRQRRGRAAAATTWHAVRAAHQGAGRAHRRAAPPAGGQARARRALQRRRADRRGGPRRRLRGDLPGHPADPGPDRGGGPRRGRRHRRALHPVGLPPRAGARRARPPAGRRQHGRRGGGRHHPARRRRDPAGQGRGRRSTRRRTTPSTASWRTWWRWPSASAPPLPGEAGHLAPGHRRRRPSSMARRRRLSGTS